MSKDLETIGPLVIPFRKNGNAKRIENEHVKKFWMDSVAEQVGDKQGCYIFAVRAAKGFTPWYVGKTKKQTMNAECFGAYQFKQYNSVLFDGSKGTPAMFFVVPPGNKKNVPREDCDQIETFLIELAYAENLNLKNKHKKQPPKWNIKGVVRSGQGKPSKSQKKFKTMLGL